MDLNLDMGLTIQDGSDSLMKNGRGRMTDGELTGSGIPEDDGDDVLRWWGSREEWSGALTLAMGEEVVSERGGGAGVTISGAHTVTAQGGAELLHACQSLCREEGGETGDKTPGPGSRCGRFGEEIEGEGQKKRKIYTGIKCREGEIKDTK